MEKEKKAIDQNGGGRPRARGAGCKKKGSVKKKEKKFKLGA